MLSALCRMSQSNKTKKAVYNVEKLTLSLSPHSHPPNALECWMENVDCHLYFVPTTIIIVSNFKCNHYVCNILSECHSGHTCLMLVCTKVLKQNVNIPICFTDFLNFFSQCFAPFDLFPFLFTFHHFHDHKISARKTNGFYKIIKYFIRL